MILFLISLLAQEVKSRSPVPDYKHAISIDQPLLGKILDQKTSSPIQDAKITIKELGQETYSLKDGSFTFPSVPLGKFTLVVEHDQYMTNETPIEHSDSTNPLEVLLVPNTLKMKEVVVVGTRSNQNSSTSTTINRLAIEHLQATNLSEVLQLVPGNPITNPDFTNTNQASIRQYSADNLGSLGTSIIVNGATLSNNGNLQSINTATAGTGASFSTSSGGGVDLRSITADNIESVEVIRGVPSVEYGDLNAGAIVVKTKAQQEPWQIKTRFNPVLTQFWAGKGFGLKKSSNSLYVDIDQTSSNDKETNKYRKYTRTTGTIQYTGYAGSKKQWMTNTTLGFGLSRDRYDMDPDFVVDSLKTQFTEKYVRLASNGNIRLNKWFSRTLKYAIATSYNVQKGYQQQYYTVDIMAESYALDNSTNEVSYLPSSFMSRMWVDGKPLNLNANLNNQLYFLTGKYIHNILMGTSWSMDANYGEGKTFTRPIRNTSGAAFRERAYNDIPALQQMAFYLQDRVTGKILDSRLNVMAGLRWDGVQPFRNDYSLHTLSPRLSVSLTTPQNVTFRGAYGITAKAPTLLYLYPENAYFDFYSLNYYATNAAERMAIITTRVYNTQNKNLKMANAQKMEAGFDLDLDRKNKRRLSITAYSERTKNGYSMSTTLNAVQLAQYPIYTVESKSTGEKPILSDVVATKTSFVSYYAPSNNIDRLNKGIELELNLGKIKATNTSFDINGAYTYTKSTSNSAYILQQNLAGRETTRIGVFPSGRGTIYDRLMTTVRAIQHIPELSFLITLSAQTIWMDRNKYIGYDSLPVGYIPYKQAGSTPSVVYLTAAQRAAIDPTADADIFLNINKATFIQEKWKPLWLFNLKLTKEFKNGLNFSFYANNFVNHRPLQSSTRYPTNYEKRNISFFFGTEVSIVL
ncbi:TonB-dependent receptor [Paracnuella aquatica]